MPGTTHEVPDGPAVQGPEPDAAPDTVKVTPGTGPPASDVTVTLMAIGRAHGGTTQSGRVW